MKYKKKCFKYMLLFWLSGIPKLQTTKYDYDAKILDIVMLNSSLVKHLS